MMIRKKRIGQWIVRLSLDGAEIAGRTEPHGGHTHYASEPPCSGMTTKQQGRADQYATALPSMGVAPAPFLAQPGHPARIRLGQGAAELLRRQRGASQGKLGEELAFGRRQLRQVQNRGIAPDARVLLV